MSFTFQDSLHYRLKTDHSTQHCCPNRIDGDDAVAAAAGPTSEPSGADPARSAPWAIQSEHTRPTWGDVWAAAGAAAVA